jgi:hypothetical protein
LQPKPAGHPSLTEAPNTRIEVDVAMKGALGRRGDETQRKRNVAKPVQRLETVDETSELCESGHASVA